MSRNPELFAEALRHHQSGRLGDAERLYREILAADEFHAGAWHFLSLITYQVGKTEDAADLIRKAIVIDGTDPAFSYNLGIMLQQLGRLEEAAGAYGSAVKLKADYTDAYNNLGNTLRALGRLDEAIGAYGKAIRSKPDHPEAHNNLGNALRDLGRLGEAVGAYGKAILLKPDYAKAQCNLGHVLQDLGRLMEAVYAYRKAIRVKPDHGEATSQLIVCQQHLCDWHEIEQLERNLRLQISLNEEKISPFAALSIDSTPAEQLAAARNWSAQHHAAITPLPAARTVRGPKIRLGYLSADFRRHAVAQLVVELIERHDRHRFDIAGYSYGPDDDSPMRQRLMKAFDRFVDIRSVSDAEAAQLIARDGIDVLIDLTGYTRHARTRILAHRPAPAQVNFLGYPGTMGADFVDYIIADPICIPPQDDAYFSETVIRLADCYQPNDTQRRIAKETPSRSASGLPEKAMVFCCFNNSFKITQAMFAIWMRVLGRNPGSVLWLLETGAEAKDNLRREAASAGIAPDRLVFALRLPLPDHLARHRLADLFLDTLPYNAHTTASDALWTGLPVLTCRGKTFAGRVAASLLTAVGMEELIAPTLADYEAMATSLANDSTKLAALRAKLEACRQTAPLFDTERFTRAIEAAYERMI